MKKLIIATILIFFAVSNSNAQSYNTGIGLRGGFFSGVTVKHFLDQKNALEGLLSTRWGGFNVTALYEVHNQAFNAPGLNWYYGAGGHIGFWDEKNASSNYDYDNYTIIGIDAILGIEYNFAEVPLNIGLDWKPILNLVGHDGFGGDGGAISIRYIF